MNFKNENAEYKEILIITDVSPNFSFKNKYKY